MTSSTPLSQPSPSLEPPRPSHESLTPISLNDLRKVYPQWQGSDPRRSSAQSLTPSITDSEKRGRRTLLLIYIHGFMGGESSFRSFPAHVHNHLKDALADSHVIHTKIYPRYKTYRAITVARDNMSAWLAPHESDTIDVVLVGHSMGGMLAADVVLLPSTDLTSEHAFKHRILGTLSLDSPFLGLHPGIIMTGIASLFRKSPEPSATQEQDYPDSLTLRSNTSGTLSPDPSIYSEISPPSGATSPLPLTTTSSATGPSSPPVDPFFNPRFSNDVVLKDRGWWKNTAHFAKKHRSEGIVNSAANHILSHLEYSGCLADYAALNARYNKLRRLEDIDPFNLASAGDGRPRESRVRFTNYYTLSTGRPKKPATPAEVTPQPESEDKDPQSSFETPAEEVVPQVPADDHSDAETSSAPEELEYAPPIPIPEEEPPETILATVETTPVVVDNSLPAIPALPDRPSPPDFDSYTDKEARKQAEREAKRVQKAYDQAVKNRDKAITERQRQIEKRRKKSLKEAEKRDRDERKQLQKALLAQASLEESSPSPAPGAAVTAEKEKEKEKEKAKDQERKFCMLPRKSSSGVRDAAWVGVTMRDMDEVTAHSALFLPGPHYEGLVGDVSETIVRWVQDDASRRAILALD